MRKQGRTADCELRIAVLTVIGADVVGKIFGTDCSQIEKREDRLAKKQIPLRLNEQLYDAIAAWAEDDFRSVNGQIEYLLTECVRQRKKNGKYVSEHLDEPPELNLE